MTYTSTYTYATGIGLRLGISLASPIDTNGSGPVRGVIPKGLKRAYLMSILQEWFICPLGGLLSDHF